ncbi:type I restriction endonuclease [Xanthocytophaga agilis]|uniref:Type I restriction endonuclease n=1 Tax=Xanthocytophaga agilis TaxID=3048010 RepID=A0AAE3UJQ0_9BACT|nr:type I restriction endonuclease [Xanthocytophaga agilis]MDJ1505518.1 type I restriction endonuclease [Xanthocytophaga agilis]
MSDFIDLIKVIGEKVSRLKDQIQTEEATKNAFIMPFISALGYDVFNPMEVVPEFVADIGIKKGEKVDYCIFKDGTPVLIVECKWHGEKLDVHNSQLHRYFHVTKTRFAMLTNGIIYRFYTDLEEPNKMDESPFLEFNITDLRESVISELKKFHKSVFNVEEILSSASELKYSREIRSILSSQLVSPSEPFVKYFASQVYNGRLTPKVIDQFSSIVRKTFAQLINDSINERLKNALTTEATQPTIERPVAQPQPEEQPIVDDKVNKVITTQEEIEAFFVVKSILRGSVRSQRITYRDAQSYFAIFMDDNNRRPVCRLYLEGKKYIGLFDGEKKENRLPIDTLEDIYTYSSQLTEAALRYPDDVKN